MSIKIVCIFNKTEIFEKVVKNNEYYKSAELFTYDNTQENKPITKCYNDFISNNVLNSDEDFWCLFIHQDFGINEDIDPLFEKLDKKFIYGAVGAKFYKGIYINRNGFKRFHVVNYGKIMQGNNDFNYYEYGLSVKNPKKVDAVDCCCILMHSSLVRKYKLQFDENLSFHMYAEELCYSAKKNHKIKTKVVQMNCFHLGRGELNEEFQKSAQYLKDKFNIKRIPSTCPN